ncbi:23S rRNA (uracil-5-)-methyltransferase RumB [Kineosphaera limosa NBRC 100340]|uniref:23S rRNA (Uracil-5-)-methyltransferase RumB n=2 Tax=Kineosphaera TaxID=211469 RepID=K6X8K9_9MICO|nr:methyltransferase domain-containing protein [Kineosphaera limosa]GAB95159.1 23S rRNA (uracil-5-)-methyltransferase RumB [Kineosphaera limosa NBRC 100340]
MGVPYATQLRAKQARVAALLPPGVAWEEPFASPESGFRTKSTMVVGGTPAEPTLGILDADGLGVDLSACGLLGPATAAAMPVLREFIAAAGLRPYEVPRRSGELKYVHVVEAADGGLLVRFVLRSQGQVGRLQRSLPLLHEQLPAMRVVSVNLLPEHKAVTAGATEILLTDETTLAMPFGEVTLHVAPGAFVQTNGTVAAALYRQAGGWIDADLAAREANRTTAAAGFTAPSNTTASTSSTATATPSTSVLDLYCGVGGFALHAARPGRVVHGVEVSPPAVASARRSAAEMGLEVTFDVGDATAARALAAEPDLLIVNPPRRGLGSELAAQLEAMDTPTVIYSSCNPGSLARDLAAMPSLKPVRARLFDMFPQTDHAEVLTLLRRR